VAISSRILLCYVWLMAWVVRLSVCLSSVTLLHLRQRLELFGNIFAPRNSSGTQTVCIKNVFGQKFEGVLTSSSSGSCKLNTTGYEKLALFDQYLTLHCEAKKLHLSICAVYRFSKWRPSAILELFYRHTRPPMKSLLLAAAACQISCQSDTQIWRYSYLNFSHIWLEMPIQAP